MKDIFLFLGGLMTGLFAIYGSDRKIKIENVTAERAKWRETMRALSRDLVHAAQYKSEGGNNLIGSIYEQFVLRLNPYDEEDEKLLKSVEKIIDKIENPGNNDNLDDLVSKFTKRVALLLKHDWERAKYEAAPWWHLRVEPKRVKYDESNDRYLQNSIKGRWFIGFLRFVSIFLFPFGLFVYLIVIFALLINVLPVLKFYFN